MVFGRKKPDIVHLSHSGPHAGKPVRLVTRGKGRKVRIVTANEASRLVGPDYEEVHLAKAFGEGPVETLVVVDHSYLMPNDFG